MTSNKVLQLAKTTLGRRAREVVKEAAVEPELDTSNPKKGRKNKLLLWVIIGMMCGLGIGTAFGLTTDDGNISLDPLGPGVGTGLGSVMGMAFGWAFGAIKK